MRALVQAAGEAGDLTIEADELPMNLEARALVAPTLQQSFIGVAVADTAKREPAPAPAPLASAREPLRVLCRGAL